MIESIDISLLIPDPSNARKHSDKNLDAIKGSLAKFGQQKPIVISQDNIVLAGNGTLAAAKSSGWQTIQVVRSALKGTEAIAYAIADNRSSELAEWEEDILSQTLKALKDENFDLVSIGFDDEDLTKWLKEKEEFVPGCDEDELPEKVEPKTKLGDLYQLGKHRLLCGDCTDIASIERLMDSKKADLVITDPPYNVAVNEDKAEGRKRRKDDLSIQNDSMNETEFEQFLKTVFTNYSIVMEEGASIYIFFADSMIIPFLSSYRFADFHYAQCCIWNKQQFTLTRKNYHYKHEPIIYGWKKGKAHSWYSDRKQSSVWDFDRPFKNIEHPTMKPINLIEYPVLNSSKQKDKVLDLFMGSGSTLIACEKNNRICYGMELDPHYCDVIVARWEKYTGKTASLLTN